MITKKPTSTLTATRVHETLVISNIGNCKLGFLKKSCISQNYLQLLNRIKAIEL